MTMMPISRRHGVRALLVSFLVGIVAWCQSEPPRAIRIVIDDTYPPFIFRSSGGKLQGILVDQWQAWAKQTGVRVDMHAMDWGQALQRMKAGEFDVIDTAFWTVERSTFLDFSKPYVSIEVPIFFREGISAITALESLRGFPVAVKAGDAAEDLLRQSGVTTVLPFTDYEAIVAAAKQGRVNVFVVDQPPALYFLNKMGLQSDFRHTEPINVGQFHRAVRKGDLALLKVIEDGFAAIDPVELERIDRKWYGRTVGGRSGLNAKVLGISLASVLVLALLLVAWNSALGRRVDRRTAALQKSEAEVHQRVQEWQRTFDAINEAIWILDRDQRVMRANLATERTFHRPCASVIGEFCWSIVHGTQEPIPECPLARAGASLHRETIELRTKEGWLEVAVDPMLDETGQFAGAVHVITDITERKQIEEALRESQAMLKAALVSMADAVFIADVDGRFIEFNDAFVSFHRLNTPSEGITGLADLREIVDVSMANGEPAPLHLRPVPRALRGEVATDVEYALSRRDTGETWFGSFSFGPIRDAEGQIVGAVVTARDITHLKRQEEERGRLEAALRQAQKMESVGRLAGGVAHDFNNLLMGIMNYVELCRDGLEADHPIREWLNEISVDAQRSADLTRQLLAFARKQVIAPKVMDLNLTVESMLKLLRRLIGEDIDMAWMPGASLWTVKMDPVQIDQILANLAVNARDAIGGVGSIRIETDNATLDEAYCAEHPGAFPGDYALLTFSDTGHGMDKETLDHAFEPFFTTKGVGQGTGLGLATVYGIVKQNGGFIDVCSEPGQGATFRIYVPRVDGADAHQVPVDTPGERPRGKETILLVEDEKSIRITARLFLEDLGYTVLLAADPKQALLLAAEHGGEVHLLITDVVMPGMNGGDLAQRLSESRPAIRRLFISGFTADVIAQRGTLDDGVNFLSKPFGRDQLARKVREVLDA